MTAQVIDIFGYAPRMKSPPTEPAVIVILPVVRKPKHCCVLECDELGVVAIDVYADGGHGLGGFAGTKFFCEKHEPKFSEDQG